MQPQQQPTPDLDKLRDEKCIPIAQEIMKDLSTDLIAIDEQNRINHNPLILKILKKTLDADLNITTEVPYLFQLMLGVFAGLNKTVQKTSPVSINDIKYANVAKHILDIVCESNVRMGSVTPEETDADFAPIIEKLNEYFKAENLSFLDIKYVMDNIFESFKNVTDSFNQNLESSSRKAEAKLFGVEDMSDLTMKRLNDVLVGPLI